MPLAAGERLGPYVVHSALGEGGTPSFRLTRAELRRVRAEAEPGGTR